MKFEFKKQFVFLSETLMTPIVGGVVLLGLGVKLISSQEKCFEKGFLGTFLNDVVIEGLQTTVKK